MTFIFRDELPLSHENNQFLIDLLDFFHVQNVSLAIFLLICLILFGLLLFALICYLIISICRKIFTFKNHHSTIISINPNNKEHFKPFEFDQPYIKQGILHYSLNYCTKLHTLTVGIIGAEDLKFSPQLTNYHTRVTMTLSIWDQNHWILLDHQQRQTLYADGLKPQWNEKFTFEILLQSQLMQTNLFIEVLTSDSIGQDECIGCLHVFLSGIDPDLYFNKDHILSDTLKVYLINFTDLGEMSIGLQYDKAHCLHIRLIEIRNLNLDKIIKSPNNYHEIYVMVCVMIGEELRKRGVITSHSEFKDLYFNRTVSVNLKRKTDNLNDVQITFQLCHSNQHKQKKQILGHISIGSKSSQNTGFKHWLAMSNDPFNMNIMWHIWNPIS
ncbi:unnamed protein product [Schistosoma turkestanicum]|nr:unnamed protein product [Schistosoma turkestanicum]